MTTQALTPNQALAQQAAELLWSCAISDDSAIAYYRSPVYQAAEAAFTWAVREAYSLTDIQAMAVRDLLAEYGPDDSLTGTTGRGVASYVQAAAADAADLLAAAQEEELELAAGRAAQAAQPTTDQLKALLAPVACPECGAEDGQHFTGCGRVGPAAGIPRPADDEAGRLAAVRALFAAFDWETGDRQYALEAIERIVTLPATQAATEPGALGNQPNAQVTQWGPLAAVCDCGHTANLHQAAPPEMEAATACQGRLADLRPGASRGQSVPCGCIRWTVTA